MGSNKLAISPREVEQWLKNLGAFLIPLVSLYLLSVIAIIEPAGHIITLSDFAINQPTFHGMILYFLNGVYDLGRKLVPNTKE